MFVFQEEELEKGTASVPVTRSIQERCIANVCVPGGGTRKGNGQCSCDKEYTGRACDHCSLGHYNSYKDDDKSICSPCHKVNGMN